MTRTTTIAAAALASATVIGSLGVTGVATAAETGTTAVTTTAVDPNDALLRAGQMPVVNEVQDWARIDDRHRRVSTAQPDKLKELGFIDRARRDFALPGGEATNVVLTFADSESAKAAYAEIKGWRRHTGDNIPAGGRLLFTSDNTPVDVDKGRGAYFSFVFKTDQDALEGTFEWLGVTRRGTAVSIIDWRVNGQDATYEVDPTIASVQAANAKLARLG